MNYLKLLTISLFVNLLVMGLLSGQKDKTDSNYYAHWEGQWYEEVNGEMNSLPSFIVKKGLYDESFEEIWIGKGGSFSKAWRAWDSRTENGNLHGFQLMDYSKPGKEKKSKTSGISIKSLYLTTVKRCFHVKHLFLRGIPY